MWLWVEYKRTQISQRVLGIRYKSMSIVFFILYFIFFCSNFALWEFSPFGIVTWAQFLRVSSDVSNLRRENSSWSAEIKIHRFSPFSNVHRHGNSRKDYVRECDSIHGILDFMEIFHSTIHLKQSVWPQNN